MSAGKRYILCANVFIQAHQTYYGFEICPGFWLALSRQHEAKRIFSIDKIRVELLALSDQLSDWVRNRAPDTFFKGTADPLTLLPSAWTPANSAALAHALANPGSGVIVDDQAVRSAAAALAIPHR